jgi:hypothetical protein
MARRERGTVMGRTSEVCEMRMLFACGGKSSSSLRRPSLSSLRMRQTGRVKISGRRDIEVKAGGS